MTNLRKLLKNRNNRHVLVISIIGVLIILLAEFSSGGDSKNAMGNGEEMGDEKRLVEILQKIEGAGRVDVMVTYEAQEKNGGIGYQDIEYISTPKGVIIVADGADTPSVRRSLKEAATAVMGVGANRVCVYKRESFK